MIRSFVGVTSVVLIYLSCLITTALSAPMTVAIGDFNARGASYSVGQSVIEMLYSSLGGNDAFRLVERRQLDQIARQQRIAMSGMVDQESAVKIGRILGAKYYIQGAISHFGVMTILTARLMDVERRTVVAAYQSMTDEGEKGVMLAVRTLAADVLASLTGPSPKGDAANDYRSYLYEALSFYNQGDYASSIKYWDKMIEMSPKNPTLRFIVAAMYYSRERYRDAELSAEEALTFDPKFPEAWLLAGKSLFMRGKDYEATDYLEKASQLRPELAEPYFLIGQAYKNRGRLEDAMEYFSIAIGKDPGYRGAYVAMGQMLLEAAQLDLAHKVLAKAVELDGADPGARFLLGTTMALQGDDGGAKAQLEVLSGLDRNLAAKLKELLK